jgi:hypothetical protein
MFLMTRAKTYIANYIKDKAINIFEIDQKLTDMSGTLHEMLIPDFDEEDGAYRKFKELHFRQYADVAEARLRQQTGLIDQETQKQKMILEAEGIAQKRALEGYSYQDERGFDVAERVASNEAVGAMTNTGMGLGMMAGVGMGVGGAVGGAVGGMVQNTMGSMFNGGAQQPQQPQQSSAPQTNTNTTPCVKCGNPLPANAKFCLECGQQVMAENEVICPSCNAKTPKGKFCLECGTPMVRKCPGCDTEIPPGGKFCLECGHKM